VEEREDEEEDRRNTGDPLAAPESGSFHRAFPFLVRASPAELEACGAKC
jgi:hypothetical protein